MPANTNPVFTLTPKISSAVPTAALTTSNGAATIGTNIFVAFTAGANGASVNRIRLSPAAAVAATATTATVARIYVSSATSGATTSANCWLFQEVQLAAQTADQAATGTYFVEVPLNFTLPAGYTILVSMHAAPAANTSWICTVFGGDF